MSAVASIVVGSAIKGVLGFLDKKFEAIATWADLPSFAAGLNKDTKQWVPATSWKLIRERHEIGWDGYLALKPEFDSRLNELNSGQVLDDTIDVKVNEDSSVLDSLQGGVDNIAGGLVNMLGGNDINLDFLNNLGGIVPAQGGSLFDSAIGLFNSLRGDSTVVGNSFSMDELMEIFKKGIVVNEAEKKVNYVEIAKIGGVIVGAIAALKWVFGGR